MSELTEKERGDNYDRFLKQLGYEKRNVGSWRKVLECGETGFPTEMYFCPFCDREQDEETPYCPECGARLE